MPSIISLFQPADIRHIGPDAQAFKTAFAVGETNTGITGIDADGVALTGIQGLNKRLQGEVERLDAENADLRRRLEILDSLLPSSPSNSPTTTQGSAGGN